MFSTLANIVTRRWRTVLTTWILVVVGLHLVSPRWDTITHDGDFAYLPRRAPSVIGEQWMEAAFPHQRGKSQVVVAIVREGEPLSNDDIHVAYDVARRMKNLYGAVRLLEAMRLLQPERAPGTAGEKAVPESRQLRDRRLAAARDAELALEDAIQLDDELADYWIDRCEAEPAVTPTPAVGFWLLTLPAGTVALDCCVTVPTVSPAPVIAVAAAACVRFTTFGTVTGPVVASHRVNRVSVVL